MNCLSLFVIIFCVFDFLLANGVDQFRFVAPPETDLIEPPPVRNSREPSPYSAQKDYAFPEERSIKNQLSMKKMKRFPSPGLNQEYEQFARFRAQKKKQNEQQQQQQIEKISQLAEQQSSQHATEAANAIAIEHIEAIARVQSQQNAELQSEIQQKLIEVQSAKAKEELKLMEAKREFILLQQQSHLHQRQQKKHKKKKTPFQNEQKQ